MKNEVIPIPICPKCGAQMQEDRHRRMEILMCYYCGHVEDGSLSGKKNADRSEPVSVQKRARNSGTEWKMNARHLTQEIRLDVLTVRELYRRKHGK